MTPVTFVTGNDEKFLIAEAAARYSGFELKQATLDIDEIQGEDAEVISLDKAKKAFELLGSPVVINDDSWSIPGLRGFPGPYMKSMNHWLKPQDFLHLTRELSDRRIILIQIIVYQDGNEIQLFRNEFVLTLLTEARGSYGNTIQKIVGSPTDNGLSIAEAYDQGTSARDREVAVGWDQFTAWYTEQRSEKL